MAASLHRPEPAGVGTIAAMPTRGHLLQPFSVSRSAQLHPVAVLLALATGGIVWRILGAFVAVPLTLIS